MNPISQQMPNMTPRKIIITCIKPNLFKWISLYLNLTVLCLHNLLFLARNAWKFDIIKANLFVPFSLPAIALFFHLQTNCMQKAFFLLNVYIKLSCAYVYLSNDLIMLLKMLKNSSRKYSLTAVHFLRAQNFQYFHSKFQFSHPFVSQSFFFSFLVTSSS